MQPNLPLDFCLIVPSTILGRFTKYILYTRPKYIDPVIVSREANSNTQLYYKKLIFVPRIFRGAALRKHYLEKILECKGMGSLNLPHPSQLWTLVCWRPHLHETRERSADQGVTYPCPVDKQGLEQV